MDDLLQLVTNGIPVFVLLFSILGVYSAITKMTNRIILIYLLSLMLSIFKEIRWYESLLFTFIAIFIYLEILIEDDKKGQILYKLRYKFVDFGFQALFLYGISWYFMSFFIIVVGRKYLPSGLTGVVYFAGLCIFLLGTTKIESQLFKLNSFDEAIARIESKKYIGAVDYNNDNFRKACAILIGMEDKAYMYRKYSYTIFNLEQLKFQLGNGQRTFSTNIKKTCRLAKLGIENVIRKDRGYSAIPQQLLRNVMLKSGYDCTVRRKIFEILYSKMFFEGLKHYYTVNYYYQKEHFKEYLLYAYFHNVNIFLRGNSFKINKFSDAFPPILM